MITGTTVNWNEYGTQAIGNLERDPYVHSSIDFFGSITSLDTCGSMYHTDFDSMPWWLTARGSGTVSGGTSITCADGTAKIFSGSKTNAANLINASQVSPTAPFIVRAKWMVNDTTSVMFVPDVYNVATAPAVGTNTTGVRPYVYTNSVAGSLSAFYAATNLGSAAITAGSYYQTEFKYTADSVYLSVFNDAMGTIYNGSRAHTFTARPWFVLGDNPANVGFGTMWLDKFSLYANNNLAVGNLGSAYIVNLYGSADNLIGSSAGTANRGTVAIDCSTTDWPLLGYMIINGTSVSSTMSRVPESGNGTLWGGNVYKYGAAFDASYNDVSSDLVSASGRWGFDALAYGAVPAGAVSGDADLVLKGGSKYSNRNPSSPLYGAPVINRDTSIDVGFTVSGTDEYLRQFSGLTDSCEVDSSGREASIHAMDKSELLRRKSVTWPILKDVPSDYVIRALLAEAGISDGQTDDNQCVDMWKFDANLNSERGVAPDASVGTMGGTTAIAGKFGTAVRGASGTNVFLGYWRDCGDAKKGYVAYWTRGSGTNLLYPSLVYLRGHGGGKATYDYLYCQMGHSGSGGYITGEFLTNIDGTNRYLTSGTVLNVGTTAQNEWHHIACTWDGQTIAQANVYLDGSLVAWSQIGTKYLPDNPSFVMVAPQDVNGAIDHLSIGTVFLTDKMVEGMWNAQSADDDQTDIDPGKNTIDWVFFDEKNAWEAVKDICLAEGARFYFNGSGKAIFQNRDTVMEGRNLDPVKTISYGSDMTSLNISEGADSIANRVIVRSNPLQKMGTEIVWQADGEIKIPGMNGSQAGTSMFYAWFNDPCVEVDRTWTGTSGTTQTYFRAAMKKKISGHWHYKNATGSVSLMGTVFAKSMRIRGSNTSLDIPRIATNRRHAVVLGSAGDTWGTDITYFAGIQGKPLRNRTSDQKVDRVYTNICDTESIGSYGENSTEINTDFITQQEYADNLATYVLHEASRPKVRISGLEIMGDPRLEPTDLVTVTDSGSSTGLNGQYWITGMDWNVGPGYKQGLSLIESVTGSWLILDHGTRGKLDCNILAP